MPSPKAVTPYLAFLNASELKLCIKPIDLLRMLSFSVLLLSLLRSRSSLSKLIYSSASRWSVSSKTLEFKKLMSSSSASSFRISYRSTSWF